MKLASVRLVTADIERLIPFYETLTGSTATRHTGDFAEFVTPGGTLAVASTRTLAPFGGEAVAAPAANRGAIIEFLVDDVDAAYARIGGAAHGGALVQAPTTMPWGNRSLLLRDPDGTLVNLFTPVTAEAVARAGL